MFLSAINNTFSKTSLRYSWNISKSFSVLPNIDNSFTENIVFRKASHEDIPFIRQCNRKCLPETYEDEYILLHQELWPELLEIIEYKDELIGYLMGKVFHRNIAIEYPKIWKSVIEVLNSSIIMISKCSSLF